MTSSAAGNAGIPGVRATNPCSPRSSELNCAVGDRPDGTFQRIGRLEAGRLAPRRFSCAPCSIRGAGPTAVSPGDAPALGMGAAPWASAFLAKVGLVSRTASDGSRTRSGEAMGICSPLAVSRPHRRGWECRVRVRADAGPSEPDPVAARAPNRRRRPAAGGAHGTVSGSRKIDTSPEPELFL